MKPHERDVLRELARQIAEIAALPVQAQTIAAWKALNALQPIRPMVMIDQIPWHEINVNDELTLCCEQPLWRRIELTLRESLYRWRYMRADFVIEPYVDVPMSIHSTDMGVAVAEDLAVLDPHNSVVSHQYHDQFGSDADLDRIRDPEVTFDADATAEAEEEAHAIFDGILTVRRQGIFPTFAPWDLIVQWRGPEATILDLIDRPDFMHRLAARITAAQLAWLDQLETQGLLGRGQSWIHCTGGFHDALPAEGYDAHKPRARDLWTFGMSQMFSTVSPAMHAEFELPYLSPWFERFGQAYYGCCEPLHLKMEVIRALPNVRKVSMSPWVDQDVGAAGLGRDFVFSRKPNPAFLAWDTWNPSAVEEDLRMTLDCCARHGCPVELILKDISTVRYEPQRLWEWAEIAARLVRE